MSLVLASRSPQRRAILTQLGLDFRIVEPTYLEEHLPLPAHVLAEQHSLGKARSVEARPGETVLGVDTIVLVDGQVLGKPADAHEAARMLRLLAGSHASRGVRSDAARRARRAAPITRGRPCISASSTARRSRSTWRAASGAAAPGATRSRRPEPALVSGIEGDFFNVVGLPVALLVEMLAERRRPVSG